MCTKLTYLISFVMVLGFAVPSVVNAHPKPVGWWKFDGDALDSSGNGLNGTLMGNPAPVFAAGMFDQALDTTEPDGPGYVAITGYKGILGGNPFSITAWINTSDISGTFMGWGSTDGGTTRFEFRPDDDELRAESSGNVQGLTKLPDNEWIHIAVTVKENAIITEPDVTLYLNGQVDNDPATGGTAPLEMAAGYDVTIARRHTSGRWFDALIDDVRLYDVELTQKQVQEAMKGIGPISTKASYPHPDSQTTDVPRDGTLSWTPGVYADKHDVYFGTNFNDVNDASRNNPRGVLASFGQDANSYDPAGLLEFGQTYYWRVDEVNAPPDFTIYKGYVWSLMVEPFAYPIKNIIATASSQFNEATGPEKTIDGSGLDNNDLHSSEETAIWVSSLTGPQPTWIQYEFDRVYKLNQMWVWNHNTSMESIVGFGNKHATIEYSSDGVNWTALGTTHEFVRAPGVPGYAANTTVDLSGVVAKYVKLTANSNWGGIMPQYGLSEVRFFYVPVVAREQNPASGATDISVDAILSWRAGREAAKHNVYFSDSNQAVIDETISPVSIPAGSSYVSYDTGPLGLAQTYYWKVNEVNEAEMPTTWQGDVLNFGTQEFLVVDDFEDYNDFEPDRIFDTWIDGWGVPTNGSQVGYATPPFAEQTIVHSGRQSMPLNYDNTTASYSEATVNIANLVIGRDWTKHGIKTLTLYFYGDPNNAVERMYVKLNGSKVIYDGDTSNIARIGWPPWNIELSSFGANLSNVTELKIGFDRSGAIGGKGVVYFDDIRLYPYNRQLITPVSPSNAGLAGYWQFEGNLNDSSGNNRHGTGVGNPTFEAGKVGQAINLRGANDYVEITGYKGILGPNDFSITAWVKSTSTGDVTMVCWGTQSGGQRVDFRLYQGRLRVEHGNGNLQGNTMLADDQWHHVAVTVSENASISYPAVKLYLDGNDDSRTTTDPDTFNIVANIDVNIGRRGTNNDRLFLGSFDEVRIYERVLTHEEIAGLAGRTKPFDKPF